VNDKLKRAATSKTSKWIAAFLAVTGVTALAAHLHRRHRQDKGKGRRK
jgi:hypothetical protein